LPFRIGCGTPQRPNPHDHGPGASGSVSTSDRRSVVRAVTFTGAGGNEIVAVQERADPVPGTDEVIVAARFAGVNWADVMQRQGFYPPPPGAPQDIPGLEVAGVVAATGAGVRDWKTGDRVFGLVGGGGLADRVVVHKRHVAAVPANLARHVAAGGPGGHTTPPQSGFTPGGAPPRATLRL